MDKLKAIGKDLKSQVQLTGVAAAKADKLELGVLGKGFTIGQAQSKGKTSVVEAEEPKKRKMCQIGTKAYMLPFKTSHAWVEDAKGNNVCEAYSEAVAKELVKMLNAKYPS